MHELVLVYIMQYFQYNEACWSLLLVSWVRSAHFCKHVILTNRNYIIKVTRDTIQRWANTLHENLSAREQVAHDVLVFLRISALLVNTDDGHYLAGNEALEMQILCCKLKNNAEFYKMQLPDGPWDLHFHQNLTIWAQNSIDGGQKFSWDYWTSYSNGR